MKLALMTGIEKLNLLLQEKIKQAITIYDEDIILSDMDISIAIISPAVKLSSKFEDFLFELRKRNIRIILLLDNEKSKYLQFALSIGITDVIFDPITIEKIIDKIKNPTPFSSIAKYYQTNYEPNISIKGKGNEIEILKKQIVSLCKFLGKEIDEKLSINEMMIYLSNEIIKKNQ